eukprot:2851287-Pyramimonas_sp.AAC.1
MPGTPTSTCVVLVDALAIVIFVLMVVSSALMNGCAVSSTSYRYAVVRVDLMLWRFSPGSTVPV